MAVLDERPVAVPLHLVAVALGCSSTCPALPITYLSINRDGRLDLAVTCATVWPASSSLAISANAPINVFAACLVGETFVIPLKKETRKDYFRLTGQLLEENPPMKIRIVLPCLVLLAGCAAANDEATIDESSLAETAADDSKPNACGFSSSSPPIDPTDPSDPRRVRVVHCKSADPTSDATVTIRQTHVESGEFRANVEQHVPLTVQRRVHPVCASWSGHFFNFEDGPFEQESFHVRTRGLGASDGDNLQLWSDKKHTKTLIDLDVGHLTCTISYNAP
jgi:hypothetical protein